MLTIPAGTQVVISPPDRSRTFFYRTRVAVSFARATFGWCRLTRCDALTAEHAGYRFWFQPSQTVRV